jgi:hypothetical protein
MKRSEWVEEVEKGCEFAVSVEGGAMCIENKERNYCSFHRCPKCELDIKEGYDRKREK